MPEEKTAPAPAPAGADPRGASRGLAGRGGPSRGQGRRPRPKSRYGQQMAEKQQLKGIFGIREEQLRRYYSEALRSRAQTGERLISLLERRLDNAIYRAGLAPTRAAARQMATHRLFAIDGRPVDIPSYRLVPGQLVTVRANKRGKSHFTNWEKRLQNVHTPSWLTLDVEQYGFRIQSEPTAAEANLGVDVQAIVEYFAR